MAHSQQARRLALWLQMLVVAPLLTALLTGSILLLDHLAIESGAIGIDRSVISAAGRAIDLGLQWVGLSAYYVPLWAVTALIAYPVSLLFRSARLARRLQGKFFPLYDDASFRRITREHIDIGASTTLPWVRGSRLDALASGLVFSLRDIQSVGSDAVPWYLPWRRPFAPVPFSCILVNGGPGSGKSRLVHHVGRTLGRRSVLGDLAIARREGEIAARTLEKGDRRRRFWWFARRWFEDPWDSGILPHSLPDGFAAWRPARPTLLWLDDPSAPSVQAWFECLRRNSDNYRFAVRLAIVGQSVVSELPDNLVMARILLAGDTGFTVGDVTGLCRAIGMHHLDLETCERVIEVTEGNPLLVELALEFLRSGRYVDEISEDAIVAERVRRVRVALSDAHADFQLSAGQQAVALGTLAGPDCAIPAVVAQFHGISLSRASLSAGFPSEAKRGVDLASVMPTVRPMMIGDAFVRDVAAERADLPCFLAKAALAANPDAFLSAVDRMGRIPGAMAEALVIPELWNRDWEPDFQMAYHKVIIGLVLRRCLDPALAVAQIAAQLDDLPEARRAKSEAALYAWIESEASAVQARVLQSDRDWAEALAAGKSPQEARRDADARELERPSFRFYSGRALAIFWSMLAARALPRAPGQAWDAAFVVARRDFVVRYHAILRELCCDGLTAEDTRANWVALFPPVDGIAEADSMAVNFAITGAIPPGMERYNALLDPLRNAVAIATIPERSTFGRIKLLLGALDGCQDARRALDLAQQIEDLAISHSGDTSSEYHAYLPAISDLAWAMVALRDDAAPETIGLVLGRLEHLHPHLMSERLDAILPGLGLSVLASTRGVLAECAGLTCEQREDLIGQLHNLRGSLQRRGLAQVPALLGLLNGYKAQCYETRNDREACASLAEQMSLLIDEGELGSLALALVKFVTALRYHAYGLQEHPEGFAAVLNRIEAIAMRPRFADDVHFRAELATTYAYAVNAFRGNPATAETYFRKMHRIASHSDLAGPGHAQYERVLANRQIALLFQHDAKKFAEFEGLLRSFVARVKPTWHQYAEFQQALRDVEKARPVGAVLSFSPNLKHSPR